MTNSKYSFIILGRVKEADEMLKIILTLDERFKDLRISRGETLDDVATNTGLAKSTINRYENMNDNHKDAHAVAVLSKYYGVSSDYLPRFVWRRR